MSKIPSTTWRLPQHDVVVSHSNAALLRIQTSLDQQEEPTPAAVLVSSEEEHISTWTFDMAVGANVFLCLCHQKTSPLMAESPTYAPIHCVFCSVISRRSIGPSVVDTLESNIGTTRRQRRSKNQLTHNDDEEHFVALDDLSRAAV